MNFEVSSFNDMWLILTSILSTVSQSVFLSFCVMNLSPTVSAAPVCIMFASAPFVSVFVSLSHATCPYGSCCLFWLIPCVFVSRMCCLLLVQSSTLFCVFPTLLSISRPSLFLVQPSARGLSVCYVFILLLNLEFLLKYNLYLNWLFNVKCLDFHFWQILHFTKLSYFCSNFGPVLA